LRHAGQQKVPNSQISDFVLDHSVVMAWSFEDEIDESAGAVLDRPATARSIVPALWPLEVANALATMP
jgi:hypothetical protein